MQQSARAGNVAERVISSRSVPLWRLFDPVCLVQALWGNRGLARQLIAREVRARYRGSYLGFLWSLITPLTTLAVYTFVFGFIFKARFGQSVSGGIGEFAVTMYCGLIAYNILAESMAYAPMLFLRNPNLVNKVVFPLEMTSVGVLGSSLVSAASGFAVVAVGAAVLSDHPGWAAFLLPLMVLPIAMVGLGVSWFLATLGVFVRDIGNSVAIITQMLLFATPIFYPAEVVAKSRFHIVLIINPMSGMVTNVRRVLLWSRLPDWRQWGWHIALGVVFMIVGYAAFRKGRRGFADVV